MATDQTPVDSKDEKPLFRDIDADEVESGGLETTVIESLCMNCHLQGETRLLLTRIPMFREVILSSFSCPHCHYKDSEVQSASTIQPLGVKYCLEIKSAKDLNRQVVKSDTASVLIPSTDFEVLPGQKGLLTTVEGMLSRAVEGLLQQQPVRKVMHPEVAAKIDKVVDQLKQLLKVEEPFTLVLDDPCGNSFLENTCAPRQDPQLTGDTYERSLEQDRMLGLLPSQTEGSPSDVEGTAPATTAAEDGSTSPQHPGEEGSQAIEEDEILSIPTNCPQCNSPGESRIKPVQIPYFKEVLIMAMSCAFCGYKSNEVKSGGGICKTGTRISLLLTDQADLSRDILKSETAIFSIPEFDFEVISGSIGGKFTTIEGLLVSIMDHMKSIFPYAFGDSVDKGDHLSMKKAVDQLGKVKNGEMLNVHICIDDPAGNSYLQNLYSPDPDPHLSVEHYQRSEDDDATLGIDMMNVD